MKSCLFVFLVGGLFSHLAGCAAPIVSLKPGPRAFTAADYSNVYDRWTRDEDGFVWGELRSPLRVSATFESWEFRRAYVVRYCADHSLPIEHRNAMLDSTLADATKYHRFYITLASENYRESDLSDNDAAWRVLLVDDEGSVTMPLEINRRARPTVVERVYFPSNNPFRQAFRVTFPIVREDGSPSVGDNSKYVILRFAGPSGQVDLRWDLENQRVVSAKR